MKYNLESSLAQNYDCLILANPEIQILDEIFEELQSLGIHYINLSKELSNALRTVPTIERSRFTRDWFTDQIRELGKAPILCSHPDILFHPSLNIDFFTLIRQAARITQVIILWPGNFSNNSLSYAIPNHHHYKVWNISDSLLIQPKMLIIQISST